MKKQAAMIAICAALLMCVAAAVCTSSTTSSPNASATANSSSQAATAAATATPTPTATPPASASGLPAGYKIYYFYEEGCPYCEAFSQTSDYARLAAQPGFTPVVSTNAAVAQQLGVTVRGYPTVVLVNSNGAVVGTWEYPNISAATIFAQA